MPERLRFGVIGTGATGLQHLNSLLHCPRASAVAVAENQANRAREVSDRFRLGRSYSDYRELLDQPDLDAVTVAVPNHLHGEVVAAALQARKHVLVEYPIALTVKEAQRVVEIARRVRCALMVAMPLRFHSGSQAARAAVVRGTLGEVYHVRCWWRRRQGAPSAGSWRTQKRASGGGCLAELGCHVLDLGLHLVGEFEARSVTAHVTTRFGPRGAKEPNGGRLESEGRRPFDVEDFAVALLRLKSGRTLALESTWAAHLPVDAPECGVELLGTAAGLSLFPARLHRPVEAGFECLEMAPSTGGVGEDRVHQFVAALLDSRKLPVPLDESLKLQRLMEAIYSAADGGQEARVE